MHWRFIAIADLIEHVEQVARRSRQPIQSRDDQHVAGLKPADRLGKLWAVSLGA